MKKSTLITSSFLAIVCLTAFTYQNSEPKNMKSEFSNVEINMSNEEPELTFSYDYGPRFSGITKATIEKATLITDLYKDDQIQDIVSYGKVSLVLIENEGQSNTREFSEGTKLSEAQLTLLKSLDYSANFNLRADCKRQNAETGEIEDSFHSPHLTIVPVKQAIYVDGKDALIKFLADGSLDEKAQTEGNKMRPAKLYFTVTKKGEISKVKIGNHSGYKEFDDKMIELMNALPGKWIPAENVDGKKVDQELVVSWGFSGC